MPPDPRILPLRNLLWLTLIGSMVFAAPATIPQHPAAVPTAFILAVWSFVVTVFSLRTFTRVGLSQSGIVTPILALVVALQSVLFTATACKLLSSPARQGPESPAPES